MTFIYRRFRNILTYLLTYIVHSNAATVILPSNALHLEFTFTIYVRGIQQFYFANKARMFAIIMSLAELDDA